jgi:hypothetical protein
MIIKNNTTIRLGAALATLTIAGALVSPQAVAHSKKHSKATYSKADRVADTNARTEMLESQLRAMQDEIASLRAQINTPAPAADAAKVQELDQWMASVKSAPQEKEHHDNTLFFRGGYAHQNNDRGGTLDPTSVDALGLASRDGVLVGPIADKDGWYFGAGFDFGLTDDVWGLMDDTQVLGELMFDYAQWANNKSNGLSPQAVGTLAAASGGAFLLPAANTEQATVNMLRLSASPKIKFFKDSAFRPWLLPVGFELSIVSPPSDAITVLAPGMQFGAGADYRIWKDIFIGADARYHYAPGDVDGVAINGVTAGGYVGIGF